MPSLRCMCNCTASRSSETCVLVVSAFASCSITMVTPIQAVSRVTTARLATNIVAARLVAAAVVRSALIHVVACMAVSFQAVPRVATARVVTIRVVPCCVSCSRGANAAFNSHVDPERRELAVGGMCPLRTKPSGRDQGQQIRPDRLRQHIANIRTAPALWATVCSTSGPQLVDVRNEAAARILPW